MLQPRNFLRNLLGNIRQVMVGKDAAIEYAIIALLCGGHVLMEDVPGVGKTTLASALARSLSCSFRRIQFTPDLMPSDVTGFTMADMRTGEMVYREGAVMSQLVLADEINRTSPRTQSALLEAMEEKQVTVDGVTRPLPTPFMVIATQNPSAFMGTYPLPEAQMDRFFLKIALGYPSYEEEMAILERYGGETRPMDSLQSVCTAEDVLEMRRLVKQIYCAPEVRSYIARLVGATRQHPALQLGASPRASIALLSGGQACALLSGRDYVVPEDIRHMAVPVMAHRLILSPDAEVRGVTAEDIVSEILETTPVTVKKA